MSCEIIDLSKEGITFLLPSNDILIGSNVDLRWEKSLEVVKNSIETRLDIFKQRKDKNQQYITDQLAKLESKESEYLKKYEEVERNKNKCELELKDIEHSYFTVKKKLSEEEEANRKLKDSIGQLELEKKALNEQLQRTMKIYLTVVSWYRDYLHIHVQFEKDKKCRVLFGSKSHDGQPFVRFEMLAENKYKLLDVNPPVECEKENLGKTYGEQDITTFLYNVRKAFLGMKIKE